VHNLAHQLVDAAAAVVVVARFLTKYRVGGGSTGRAVRRSGPTPVRCLLESIIVLAARRRCNFERRERDAQRGRDGTARGGIDFIFRFGGGRRGGCIVGRESG